MNVATHAAAACRRTVSYTKTGPGGVGDV